MQSWSSGAAAELQLKANKKVTRRLLLKMVKNRQNCLAFEFLRQNLFQKIPKNIGKIGKHRCKQTAENANKALTKCKQTADKM